MAMKKAEMEDHHTQYRERVGRAWSAAREGRYEEAVEQALSSWDFVDGMMQFERRYMGAELVPVDGIYLVLKFAPLLFDFESLDQLEVLLKRQRRIEKNSPDSIADQISKARSRMWEAHRLWGHLEQLSNPTRDELSECLGDVDEQWRSIIDVWEKTGLVRHTPDGRSYRLSLWSPLDEVVRARCPACAVMVKAAKVKLLEQRSCPKYRESTLFVLIAEEN